MKPLIRNRLQVRSFFSPENTDRRAKVCQHSFRLKKLVPFFLSALLLIMVGLFESCELFQASQEWTLVNQAGDIAYVEVPAGTFSSTFTEISSSDDSGWYVYIPGMERIRLQVGGNISGSSWSFVTLTGSGPGVNVIGYGGGTADAAFPSSWTVSGTVTINTQGPGGTTSGTASWTGTRTK